MKLLRLGCLWLCTLLAACGGGSLQIAFVDEDDDGFFFSSGLRLPGGSDQLDAGVLALALYDSLAGLERLVTQANAYAQIAGPAGGAVVTACHRGSISTRKTAATTFVLDAQGCQLLPGDPLVYDGSWFFSINASSYPASGICAAGTACVLTATVDNSLAAFGYARPGMRVTGREWRQETGAAGAIQAQVRASGERTVIAGSAFTVTGTRELLQTVDFNVIGDRVRRTLRMTQPFNETITIDPLQLLVAVDRDADGTADITFAVPWEWIVD